MQRLRDERGAVGVVVALLMVPLLGFAALAIDVSAIYAERQQLQTGADAGALAIAQDCGRGACGTPSSTAQALAASNLDHGTSTATITALTSAKVTVRNGGVKKHWFAPVLGVSSSTLTASATVAWGSPTGGTAVLPLAFSLCEWTAQTHGGMPTGTASEVIYLTKSAQVATNCTGPSGNLVPGGFGWITTDPGACHSTSNIAGILRSDPGNSVPGSCSTSDLNAAHNATVLLPIFDQMSGTGSGATYRVYGYAAFRLTGYRFGGKNNWGTPCNGNARCIQGYFTRFVDIAESFHYGAGAPQLGASIVSLTN